MNNPVIADLVKNIEINQDNMMKLNLVIQIIDSSSISGEMTSPQIGRAMGINDGSVRKIEERAIAKIRTNYEAMLNEEDRFIDNKMEESKDPSITSGESKIWQN